MTKGEGKRDGKREKNRESEREKEREREIDRIGYMVINASSVMKIFSNDADDIE